MSTADGHRGGATCRLRRLFERALLRRERREDSVVFAFRADGGTREALDDLARREAACCPFLDYRVEAVGDEVVWTTSNPLTGSERAAVDAFLDALYALPDHTGSDIDGFSDGSPTPASRWSRSRTASRCAQRGESPSCRSRERLSSTPHASVIWPSWTR